MKYFILNQGKEYHHDPVLKNWFGILDWHHLEKADEESEEQILLDMEIDDYTIFTDIMTHPCLLVSEEMKRIISRYDQQITYRGVFLLDQEKQEGRLYYVPFLPSAECFTKDSTFSGDRSRVKRGVVDADELQERHIAEAAGLNGQCVIISLDLAEAFLRAGMSGIGLTEMEIVETEACV